MQTTVLKVNANELFPNTMTFTNTFSASLDFTDNQNTNSTFEDKNNDMINGIRMATSKQTNSKHKKGSDSF